MKLSIVAAVAANGVIGREGGMPWHYPEDLQHFKQTTTGHPVIMGRRTFESIRDRLGGPLPDRTNIVLTSTPDSLPDGVVGVGSVDEAVSAARARDDEAYVVGGETVYRQFLPDADELVLTELSEEYEGDTHFPDWSHENWTEVERDDREEFAFVTYRRRASTRS
ncbi:dihydrofolate reductase [Salarchaeum japonicum]|uniref:dihydrofolate reductase n=1 Tax=Salarchaeum japonicum TaxID=555573 RepID=UPI003C72474A